MNENLDKRKKDIKNYLEEQFKEMPRKWWQTKTDDYTPTRDMGSGRNLYPHNPEETIVKYDFKRALISSALFLCFNLLVSIFIGYHEKKFPVSFVAMISAVGLIIAFQLRGESKNGFLMFFDKQGFWIKGMPQQVSWNHLAVSYIRTNYGGEDPSHYLLLYYYDEIKDEFSETEYCLEGLDTTKEHIAAAIEYFRNQVV